MMKRLGIDYKETEYIKEVFKLKYLKITGVYTHLCDVKDKYFTVKQLKSYDKVVDMLKINGYSFKTHIQAAEALFRYPEYKYDYVRIGIGLMAMVIKVLNLLCLLEEESSVPRCLIKMEHLAMNKVSRLIKI